MGTLIAAVTYASWLAPTPKPQKVATKPPPPITTTAAVPPVANRVPPAPVPLRPAAPSPGVPALSLEVPDKALADARAAKSQVAPTETNWSGALEMVFPAPGCPEQLPSYRSAVVLCRNLEGPACDAQPVCRWYAVKPGATETSKAPQCLTRSGAYVPPPDIDPATAARFGMASIPDMMDTTYPAAEAAIAKGDNDAANGRVERAITTYSALLRSQPDFPQALNQRAMAYEIKGDTKRAVADYCRILLVSGPRHRRAFARGRIAVLTGQGAPGISTPAVTAENSKIAPIPPTGDIQSRRRRNAIAPFSVETAPGPSYLVKLVNISDARDQIMVFVRGGETYSTKVPLGTYHLKAATGQVWYGKENYFGTETRFLRVRNTDRGNDDGVQAFKFHQSGNRLHGLTISFKKVVGGNTSEEPINREEF